MIPLLNLAADGCAVGVPAVIHEASLGCAVPAEG